MREYRPKRSSVLFVGVIFLLTLGLAAFILYGLSEMLKGPGHHTELLIFGPMLLLFVLGSAGLGWFLISNLATYRIDPSGITRIVLWQQSQFLWRDMVNLESTRNVQYGTTWTLTDTNGKKLKIPLFMVERGYGLEGFLDAYAAPLREQQRKQSSQAPQVYRYGKAPGTLMLVCGLLFLCFVVGAIVASREQPGPGWGMVLPMSLLVFGGFGAVALGVAAYFYSYAIRITAEAITESSLFSTKTLPFAEITAFYAGAMPTSNGQIRTVTEVVGKNGKKIQANAQLANYDALTATLRSSMDATVLEQGQQEKAVVTRSTRKQQAKIMMVAGPLTAALTVGLWFLTSGDGFTRLERQNRLDREGRSTQGVVTGRRSQREGKSGTGYYIDFEFEVAGKTYQRESPVNGEDYDNIPDRSPTGVLYVSADPTISRMSASIGRSKAIREIVGLGIYVLLAIPTGIGMFLQGRKIWRAENAAENVNATGGRTT